jgi:hypothetical protein
MVVAVTGGPCGRILAVWRGTRFRSQATIWTVVRAVQEVSVCAYQVDLRGIAAIVERARVVLQVVEVMDQVEGPPLAVGCGLLVAG